MFERIVRLSLALCWAGAGLLYMLVACIPWVIGVVLVMLLLLGGNCY